MYFILYFIYNTFIKKTCLLLRETQFRLPNHYIPRLVFPFILRKHTQWKTLENFLKKEIVFTETLYF